MLVTFIILYVVGCIVVAVKEYKATGGVFDIFFALTIAIVFTPIFAPKLLKNTR